MLHVGNCIDAISQLPDESVDSVVTDPPYELGFMGKSWDSTGIAFNTELWRQCFRVLKPGGHLLAFSGSRTYHRMAVAIEDSGFEIRDQIMWVYGSGFPKSMDVSKAIDKQFGAEREVIGTDKNFGASKSEDGKIAFGDYSGEWNITKPATEEAKQWEGWGTALKPAHEPIVMARKPLDGTVAQTVLKHGTGGINVDGCRVKREDGDDSIAGNRTATFGTQETVSGGNGSGSWEQNDIGRFPANFIHDGSDEVLQLFPNSKAGKPQEKRGTGGIWGKGDGHSIPVGPSYGDNGSAARFFYCAKASKAERNKGLEYFPDRRQDEEDYERAGTTNPRNRSQKLRKNHHPTVKPVALMRYLTRLVTPPNGTVLDPFLGSGTTAVAAVLEGFKWIGCEMNTEYSEIIMARVNAAEQYK